jgi:hypothetical protein
MLAGKGDDGVVAIDEAGFWEAWGSLDDFALCHL